MPKKPRNIPDATQNSINKFLNNPSLLGDTSVFGAEIEKQIASLYRPDLDRIRNRDLIEIPEYTTWLLSGGGAKGSFQVGATSFLWAHESTRPNAIVGTSVGSINTLKLAEGTDSAIQDMIDVWLSLFWKGDMVGVAEWIRNIDRIASEVGIDLGLERKLMDQYPPVAETRGFTWPVEAIAGFAGLSLPREIIIGITASIYEHLSSRIEEAKSEIENAKSLYTLSPVMEKLQENLNIDALQESDIQLRLLSIDLEGGARCLVDKYGRLVRYFKDSQTSTTSEVHQLDSPLDRALIDGSLASSAIPIIFPPVVLRTTEGQQYTCVDGGVLDTLPMSSLKEVHKHLPRIQSKRAISISTTALLPSMDPTSLVRPLDTSYLREIQSYTEAGLLDIGLRSLGLVTDEILRDDVHPDGGWCDEIERINIFPSFDVHDVLEIDPGLILISITYGYMTAFDVITNLEENFSAEDRYIAFITTNGIAQTRRHIWELEQQARFEGYEQYPRFRPGIHSRIRACKRYIFDLTVIRVRRFGIDSIPVEISDRSERNTNNFEDWWLKWERHRYGPWINTTSTNPFTRFGSPWEKSYDWFTGAEIPEEDPPVFPEELMR